MAPAKRTQQLVMGIMAAATVLGWQAALAAGTTEEYQQVPLKINAALVLDDKLMVGDGYSIESVAVNDGYSNNYYLQTEVGEVTVISDYQLARKIQEIQALQTLDAMSRAGVFGDAMKGGVMAPVHGTRALVTSPVQTTKGAVKGVGRWMGNIGRAIGSDDPYQEGGFSAAVGWAGTKRAFALELGVDPYTDWEPLKDALKSVSRAAFAGGITVGMAMDAATAGTTTGTVISVTSLSGEMNDILLDNPPEALTKLNRKKLKGLGISRDVIDPFLLNYNYSPMEKTLLVEALSRMDGAKGRELFIAQAAAAPDQVIARYMQQMAEMMANYYTAVEAADIVKVDTYVWLLNRKGTLVGVFPIDYLAWTQEASSVVKGVEKDSRVKTRELWLEGSVSPLGRKALINGGWTVKERVALLTGDALQDQTASGAGMGATSTAIGVIAP